MARVLHNKKTCFIYTVPPLFFTKEIFLISFVKNYLATDAANIVYEKEEPLCKRKKWKF